MEAIVVIAGIAAAVWGGIVFLRGGLTAGALLVLLAGTCFSVPFYKVELGSLPLTADRAMLVLLVLQYVLWRRMGRLDPKPIGKPEIILLALVGLLLGSTFTHDWRAANYQPVAWLIVNYLMPVAMYWMMRQARWTEREVLAVFGGFALFGVYLALTSLAEYFQLGGLVFPSYITTSAMDSSAEFVGRARGPLLHPIGNGILLAICLGCVLLWWPRLRRAGQLGILAVAMLLLTAIYFSLTRSVWMGGAFAVGLAVSLALPWSWRWPMLGIGVLAATIVLATQWDNIVAFKRDKALGAEKTADSVALRPILATIAWKMFLDRPLLGCGYAQYGTEHLQYTSDRSTSLPLERGRGYIPHNVAFALLTEMGIVGLGLFVTLLSLWARDAWRLWRETRLPLWARQQGLLLLIVLGVYLINGMFHEVSVIPMANMTLFFLAGVTAGLRPLLTRLPGSAIPG